MNLFDSLVDSALASQPSLSALRPVVEKEILHRDILREMSVAGLLDGLTFIGGTCLRDCYGSVRLSEDLDFTGGRAFDRSTLSSLGQSLIDGLKGKYGLEVIVSDPVRETGNVDTWKLKVVTRPETPHLPAQRINIDICAVDSHDRKPSMILNHYRVDMGTDGLILYAESREEILADKIVALALRPNRVKNRDLWDILWLIQHGVVPNYALVSLKLADRHVSPVEFNHLFEDRIESLRSGFADYSFEITRFLPTSASSGIISQAGYWEVMLSALRGILGELIRSV